MQFFVEQENDACIYGMIPDPITTDYAFLSGLYVPEAQRCQGIGTRLLMSFIGSCIDAGMRGIRSEFRPFVQEDAYGMRAFYERHGFSFYIDASGKECIRKDLTV